MPNTRLAKCIRASGSHAHLVDGEIYTITDCDDRAGRKAVNISGVNTPDGWLLANRFQDLITSEPVHEDVTLDISDPVNHPVHYTNHPSGVEAITVTEHMGFCLGNVMKYIWRADLKDDAIEDLEKAAWYLQREIVKRKSNGVKL